MEEKFYHPDVHVFNNEASDSQPVNAETQDSRLMEKISEDISRKDVEQLKLHCMSTSRTGIYNSL